jgi:GABA(A) receptor-associated protein
MATKFKSQVTLEDRIKDSERIRQKYPERVPVICERHERASTVVPIIDKKKYLVPSDLQVAQFSFVIRKRLKLTPEQTIFLFVNGRIPSPNAMMNQVYDEHRDKDGFLYVTYAPENTFGSSSL